MSQIPNPCFRLLFKLPFYLLAGAVGGLLIAIAWIESEPSLRPSIPLVVFALCNGGWLLALEIWFIEYRCRKSRVEAPQRDRPAHLPYVETPVPHRDRLAKFLDRSQAELEQEREEYVSRMPFWSRINFWSRSAPKPVSAIQVILRRINRTLK